ncbi:MAG TPA: shikimate kinase [Smithella sp.]|nr:shikimate kinase [Smithella sp.]
MQKIAETSEILRILTTTQPRLVGVDGVDGSGKSWLATLLSKELGWPHIDLDDHIENNMGGYVEHVHYDDVQNILNNTSGSVIIEGVCLLHVLEGLKRHLDFLIYVKRVAHYGRWYDEEDCTVSEDIDDFINNKRGELRKFAEVDAYMNGEEPRTDVEFPALDEEIIRYHYNYTPQDKADIVYERID